MEKCHCGKNGHALNSINCPVHGSASQDARMERIEEAIKKLDKVVKINALPYKLETGINEILNPKE